MQPNYAKACGHASRINLATIPGDHERSSITMSNDDAVREVLARLADAIEKEMRLIAKDWKDSAGGYCMSGGTPAARAKALYDGMNCALGAVQRQWEQLGRRDPILAIMPPTDGYDDNGTSRDGIADYCKLIEQDIPW